MIGRILRTSGIVAVVAWAGYCVGFSAGQEKKTNNRIYELRIYTTVPGRLPALHKRFAEHTMKLFEKHGMRNEMYWVPADEDNKLVYLLSHESREAAERSWRAFSSDPDWQKARTESEKDGKIVEKVERIWLQLTDYSPRR